MGIKHLYHPRSIEFAERIRRDTRRLWPRRRAQLGHWHRPARDPELLALGGRFIDIGKRDIYGDTGCGSSPFRANLPFYGVDLRVSARHRKCVVIEFHAAPPN